MELNEMLKRARTSEMSPEQREEQRQSLAYGNTKFENDRITRSTIDHASKELAAQSKTKG